MSEDIVEQKKKYKIGIIISISVGIISLISFIVILFYFRPTLHLFLEPNHLYFYINYISILLLFGSIITLIVLLIKRKNLDKPERIERTTSEEKSRLVAFLLCIFFGTLGVHRFYVEKTTTGIVWLLTGGLFGIGAFIDLLMILTGNFTDIHGNRLINWDIPSSKSKPPKAARKYPTEEEGTTKWIYCHKCGGQNPVGKQFCGDCGAQLVTDIR